MLGITEKQIREIDLGPRQLFLFDIEDDASADRQRVMDCLAGHVERLGQADLKDFVVPTTLWNSSTIARRSIASSRR